MKRLISVGLGLGYIIFEAFWMVWIRSMNISQTGIAFVDVVDDNTEGDEIVYLLEGDVLRLHFSIYRDKMLCSAIYGTGDTFAGEKMLQ
jgi:hypothetical protein